MSSIAALPPLPQGGGDQNPQKFPSQFPIVAESSLASEDHEDEEEMRRRLDEWRSMAANLAGGFTQMPNQVREDPALSSNAKLVYEHLLRYMWKKEWCWPGQGRIAKEIGISRRTVIRACKELYERYYIEKWRRGLGKTNIYFINPLAFVASTSLTTPLTEVTLRLPEGARVTPNSPTASLYGITFYANDAAASSLDTEKCQDVISRSDTMAQPDEPESHTKHTKKEENKEEKDRYSNNSTQAPKGMVFDLVPTTIRNDERYEQGNDEDTKSNIETNDLENGRAESAKEVKAAKNEGAKKPPSAQAQAIAAATGIPAAHLAELGIAQEPRRRPVPDFIARIIADFTRDLGDSQRSGKSNATRAAKLYYFGLDYCKDAQEDPEGWFNDQLYKAKQAALNAPAVKKRTGNRINRIPIFFFLLEREFGFNPDELAYIRSDLALLQPEDRNL